MYPLKLTSSHVLRRRKDRLKLGATLLALLSGSVSLLVTAMWLSHADEIAALWPPLLDMKFNATLGFTASAGALLLFVHGRPHLATVLALVPLLFGAITLWEHVSGLDAHVDQLLLTDWSGVGTPGRAAPNSAAVQLLFGATALAMGLMRGGGRQDMVVKLLCVFAIAIAAETVAGHIVGSRAAVGWGSKQSMSMLDAACVITLAIGVGAQCIRAEMRLFSQASLWIPGLLAFGIAFLDLSTSLEYQVGLCYVALAACGLWFPRRTFLTIFTATGIGLVLFGLFVSPPGDAVFWPAIINRGLAIGAILLVAVLVGKFLRGRETRRRMVDHLASIQGLTETGSFELDFATMTFVSTIGFDAIHGLQTQRSHDWAHFVETLVPVDEHDTIARFIADARRGECGRTLDYSFLRSDGDTREAVLRCLPMTDERGVAIKITGIVYDVTRERRSGRAQIELEAQIRHAQKLESLGTMAGGVAHDLNNILVPITMLAPLLLETSRTSADRETLQLIIGSARRARELVREMLVFTRRDPATFEPVRLDLLVRESLTILRAGLPAGVTIIDALQPVPDISGSKGQLCQVLLNLAINAAQAIGPRAGQITIGTAVEISGDPPASVVRLFVCDDGDGMEPATLERVFEPFFSTKEAAQGTGIGLSIVYGIVKKHGGTISAQSSRGSGARFDMVFPALVEGRALCLAA